MIIKAVLRVQVSKSSTSKPRLFRKCMRCEALTSACLCVVHVSLALCCAGSTQTPGPVCLPCPLSAFCGVPATSLPLPGAEAAQHPALTAHPGWAPGWASGVERDHVRRDTSHAAEALGPGVWPLWFSLKESDDNPALNQWILFNKNRNSNTAYVITFY